MNNRLIPAWAGKTITVIVVSPAITAHPRVGGENRQRTRPFSSVFGSSPRGRGKLLLHELSAGEIGLIPAWAGKTTTTAIARSCPRAHPRVGGENVEVDGAKKLRLGSSPRGRGKPGGGGDVEGLAGLIPAWAGKTCRTKRSTSGAWAHPRVGGENCYNVNGNKGVTGSSPRGRGKRGRPLQ